MRGEKPAILVEADATHRSVPEGPTQAEELIAHGGVQRQRERPPRQAMAA